MCIRYSSSLAMRSIRISAVGIMICATTLFAANAAIAGDKSVIYNFPPYTAPQARPLEDPSGALLVTVPDIGDVKGATVVKISEDHGVWKGHLLYKFKKNEGSNPVAGLVEDPNGVLYGATQDGGAHGQGTIYSLTQNGDVWTEQILHNFTGGKDGSRPDLNLVFDKATGTLYGTAPSGGGDSGCGTAYSLAPSGGGWTFNTIYSFGGGTDGCVPNAAIHAGPTQGTYFGTTYGGGSKNYGTVYELAESNGVWSESVIYSFAGGLDGRQPQDLDVDPKSGNLFGVAAGGGSSGKGVAFELTNNGPNWTQSVLYNFRGGDDGGTPVGVRLEKDAKTLYGATQLGGVAGYGTLFKLEKNGSSWTETVLDNFGNFRGDGQNPQSRPIEDTATGILYGTTANGGRHGGGIVYGIAP